MEEDTVPEEELNNPERRDEQINHERQIACEVSLAGKVKPQAADMTGSVVWEEV